MALSFLLFAMRLMLAAQPIAHFKGAKIKVIIIQPKEELESEPPVIYNS